MIGKSTMVCSIRIRRKINPGLSGLTAELFGRSGVPSAVFDEVGAALAEGERYIFAQALLADIQHPIIMERARMAIRFASDDYQLDAVEIRLNIDSL